MCTQRKVPFLNHVNHLPFVCAQPVEGYKLHNRGSGNVLV